MGSLLPVEKEATTSVTVSRFSNVQIEVKVASEGAVTAEARRQTYEVVVYVFLPPGIDVKDTNRPFSQIWTITALHTPKIPLHALSTPFAPTMLEGHFTTCLQDIRNQLRKGGDAHTQTGRLLQQLYLQAAMYVLAITSEVDAATRKLRHSEWRQGGEPADLARLATATVRQIVEAIQRLQQVCSACDKNVATQDIREAWHRVDEHIMLSAQTALIKLLQAFDKHVENQGIQLVTRSASMPVPDTKAADPLKSGRLPTAAESYSDHVMREKSGAELVRQSDAPIMPPVHQQTTLRELLLQMVQISNGHQDGSPQPTQPSPKPRDIPEQSASAILARGAKKAVRAARIEPAGQSHRALRSSMLLGAKSMGAPVDDRLMSHTNFKDGSLSAAHERIWSETDSMMAAKGRASQDLRSAPEARRYGRASLEGALPHLPQEATRVLSPALQFGIVRSVISGAGLPLAPHRTPSPLPGSRLAYVGALNSKIDFSGAQEEQAPPNPFAIFREQESAATGQANVTLPRNGRGLDGRRLSSSLDDLHRLDRAERAEAFKRRASLGEALLRRESSSLDNLHRLERAERAEAFTRRASLGEALLRRESDRVFKEELRSKVDGAGGEKFAAEGDGVITPGASNADGPKEEAAGNRACEQEMALKADAKSCVSNAGGSKPHQAAGAGPLPSVKQIARSLERSAKVDSSSRLPAFFKPLLTSPSTSEPTEGAAHHQGAKLFLKPLPVLNPFSQPDIPTGQKTDGRAESRFAESDRPLSKPVTASSHSGGKLDKGKSIDAAEDCVAAVQRRSPPLGSSAFGSSFYHSTGSQAGEGASSKQPVSTQQDSMQGGTPGQAASQRSKSFLKPFPIVSPFSMSDELPGSEVHDPDGGGYTQEQAQEQEQDSLAFDGSAKRPKRFLKPLPVSSPFGSYNTYQSATSQAQSSSPNSAVQSLETRSKSFLKPLPVVSPFTAYMSPSNEDLQENEGIHVSHLGAISRDSTEAEEGSPRAAGSALRQPKAFLRAMPVGRAFREPHSPAADIDVDENAPKRLRGFLKPKEPIPEGQPGTAFNGDRASNALALQSHMSQPRLERQRRIGDGGHPSTSGSSSFETATTSPVRAIKGRLNLNVPLSSPAQDITEQREYRSASIRNAPLGPIAESGRVSAGPQQEGPSTQPSFRSWPGLPALQDPIHHEQPSFRSWPGLPGLEAAGMPAAASGAGSLSQAGSKSEASHTASVVKGPVDYTAQLRQLAMQRSQTRRKISYIAPEARGGSTVKPAIDSKAATLGLSKSQFSSPEADSKSRVEAPGRPKPHVHFEDSSSSSSGHEASLEEGDEGEKESLVASKLRAARAKILDPKRSRPNRANRLSESEVAELAGVPNTRARAAARLSTRLSAFGKALTGRTKSCAMPEDKAAAAEVDDEGQDVPSGEGDAPMSAAHWRPAVSQQTVAQVPYVKPKLKGSHPIRGWRAAKARDNALDAQRTLDTITYVHKPTPGPFEDIVNPLPIQRMRSKSRRGMKEAELLSGLSGVPLERDNLAMGSASSLERLRIPLYVHSPAMGLVDGVEVSSPHSLPSTSASSPLHTADQQLEILSEIATLAAVAPAVSKDQNVEAVLHALMHPSQRPKPDQPITLGKGKKALQEGLGALPEAVRQRTQKAARERSSTEVVTTEIRAIRKSLGQQLGRRHTVGVTSADADQIRSTDSAVEKSAWWERQGAVSKEERLQQDRRRLRVARQERKALGPTSGPHRWEEAFRKATGLPAVLKKARLMQLSHAEQSTPLDAENEELRTRATLKQTRGLLCSAIQELQEERLQRGYTEGILGGADGKAGGEIFVRRAAIIARTAQQAVMLRQKLLPPKPVLMDLFTWLAGISSIACCAATIYVADQPLPILVSEATGKDQDVVDNTLRLIAYILLSLANIAVWVVILRDKWLAHEQSINLLGVVSRRKGALVDHTGKDVGSTKESYQTMTDDHIDEAVLRARHAHKGFLPGAWHLDRPENAIVYSRTVQISWDKLERQMQAVDGVDFKIRMDLSSVLISLDDPLTTYQRLQPAIGGKPALVEDVQCQRIYNLHSVVSVCGFNHKFKARTVPKLHRVRMTVQQSGIKSVQMQDAASDAAERRQKSRAIVAEGAKTATEAFRKLMEKAEERQMR